MLKHRVAAAWREFEAAGFEEGIEAAVDGFLLSFFKFLCLVHRQIAVQRLLCVVFYMNPLYSSLSSI